MRVWKRGFTVGKAELAKKKKNLTGEKQLNIFFLSLSLSHSSYFLLILPVPMIVFA